eukprot:4506491-Pleurochrysis_carterae.AAC.1
MRTCTAAQKRAQEIASTDPSIAQHARAAAGTPRNLTPNDKFINQCIRSLPPPPTSNNKRQPSPSDGNDSLHERQARSSVHKKSSMPVNSRRRFASSTSPL